MAASIPRDILLQIIPHLPTESALRFKCVCKAWSSAVDDHHCNGMLLLINQPFKYLTMLRGNSRSSRLHRVDGTLRVSSSSVPSPILDSHQFLNSACLGLLCYVSSPIWGVVGCTVRLWNPLRNEVTTVPELSSPGSHSVFGLGFDSTTNTYKILHIFVILPNSITEDLVYNVEVYTLGTKSSWRKIEAGPRFVPPKNKVLVFANQAIHWHVTRLKPGRKDYGYIASEVYDSYVVSFDLANEVFRSTHHPKAENFHLVELNGRLAMVDRSDDFRITVWMLEENYSDWIQAHVIRLRHNGGVEIMGTWNNAEDLLLKTMSDGVISYNIKSGKLEYVDIPAPCDRYDCIVGFRGSLRSLGSA